MSIMKRMRDITVATLNERLEQCEDPIRMIDQYLHAQREQIRESERLYQQCVNHASSLRQQVLTAEQFRQKREQQAMMALKAGEEHAAKLALQEKLLQEEKIEQYGALYEQSKRSILELEEQLHQLRADYDEVYNKRQYYLARMESVRLQQQMNARMSSMNGYAGPGVFGRLENRISDLEFETKSLRDVRRITQESLYSAGNAVRDTLEKELQTLKNKLEQEGWIKR